MEYLDFSSVITTIRKYISDAHSMNQIDMMYQLFVSFLSSDESTIRPVQTRFRFGSASQDA